jgi:hypothetical protein
MAMTKDEFIKALRKKTLNELDEWCWKIYENYQKKLKECESLKGKMESENAKKKREALRKENAKLKALLNRISEASTIKETKTKKATKEPVKEVTTEPVVQ